MGRDIQEMLMGGPWLELSLSVLARAGNKLIRPMGQENQTSKAMEQDETPSRTEICAAREKEWLMELMGNEIRGGLTRERERDRQTDRQTDRERQTDRQTGRQTGRQTEGERQTDRKRERECVCVLFFDVFFVLFFFGGKQF